MGAWPHPAVDNIGRSELQNTIRYICIVDSCWRGQISLKPNHVGISFSGVSRNGFGYGCFGVNFSGCRNCRQIVKSIAWHGRHNRGFVWLDKGRWKVLWQTLLSRKLFAHNFWHRIAGVRVGGFWSLSRNNNKRRPHTPTPTPKGKNLRRRPQKLCFRRYRMCVLTWPASISLLALRL